MVVTVYYKDGFTEEFDDVRKIEDDRFGYDPVIEYVTYDIKHGTFKKVKCLLEMRKLDHIDISI